VPRGADRCRPHAAVRLGDAPASHRRGVVSTLSERVVEVLEQALSAVCLHLHPGLPIDPGRCPIRAHPLPCLRQHVRPVDAVIHGMEAPLRRPIGRHVWPPSRIAAAGGVAPCPQVDAPGGGRAGRSRPCPDAYLSRRREQCRGPSRRQPVPRLGDVVKTTARLASGRCGDLLVSTDAAVEAGLDMSRRERRRLDVRGRWQSASSSSIPPSRQRRRDLTIERATSDGPRVDRGTIPATRTAQTPTGSKPPPPGSSRTDPGSSRRRPYDEGTPTAEV